LNRERCLLKNKNLVMATELFYKELKDDVARTELAICEKCTLSEMREILRK